MSSAAEKVHERQLKENERKWTKTLMDAGWTAMPSVILDRQQALGLDAVDVNILMHLAKHWWEKDRLPFPTKKAIAECIGVSKSTVQRRIAKLERDGLIKRVYRFSPKHQGQRSNAYDFAGLIKEATPYAEEALAVREKRRKDDAARRKRKGLRIVRDDGEEARE
jgi:DNA-binding Lrp family transcriptional regulator